MSRIGYIFRLSQREAIPMRSVRSSSKTSGSSQGHLLTNEQHQQDEMMSSLLRYFLSESLICLFL